MSEISMFPDREPAPYGHDSRTDDMILADQIRHGYDPFDIPDRDERIPSSLARSLDLPAFPEWNGSIPEGKVKRASEYDPGQVGTVGSQLDLRDALAVPISITGPGSISGTRGFIRGWSYLQLRYSMNPPIDGVAETLFALTDSRDRILVPFQSQSSVTEFLPFAIPYNGLNLKAFDVATHRVWGKRPSDDSSVTGFVIYVTPVEGI